MVTGLPAPAHRAPEIKLMPNPPKAVVGVVLAVAACPLSAQATLTVGAGGFPTISAAIVAAQPGDTILVSDGIYPESFTVDKGVRLLGRNARIQQPATSFPRILVQNIPAGQTFAMTGFGIDDSAVTVSELPIEVRNCAGTVTIADLTNSGTLQRWRLSAFDSGAVHAARCALSSLVAADSFVVAEDCQMRPRLPSGVQTDASTVALVGCDVWAGSTLFTGPGAQVNGGTLSVTRSSIRGGAALGTFFPAIVATAGSQLRLDPSTQLSPTGSQPAVVGGVSTFLPLTSTTARSDGAVLTAVAHGPAAEPFAMLVSLPVPTTPTPFGVTWLDPGFALTLYFAAFGAVDRLHQAVIPHPPLPAGLVMAVQPIRLATLMLGTPSLVVLP